jgi:hypothetical protein
LPNLPGQRHRQITNRPRERLMLRSGNWDKREVYPS